METTAKAIASKKIQSLTIAKISSGKIQKITYSQKQTTVKV